MSLHPRIHGSGRLGKLLILTMLMNGPAGATADDLFVSPDGQSGAAGTSDDPLDLDTALNDATRVYPGDTVWLMEGTYVGPFTKQSVPSGTPTDPIIYRAVPGARVTLTAAYDEPYALALSDAEHVWIWGIEATMGGAEELGYIPSAAVYILGGRDVSTLNDDELSPDEESEFAIRYMDEVGEGDEEVAEDDGDADPLAPEEERLGSLHWMPSEE